MCAHGNVSHIKEQWIVLRYMIANLCKTDVMLSLCLDIKNVCK